MLRDPPMGRSWSDRAAWRLRPGTSHLSPPDFNFLVSSSLNVQCQGKITQTQLCFSQLISQPLAIRITFVVDLFLASLGSLQSLGASPSQYGGNCFSHSPAHPGILWVIFILSFISILAALWMPVLTRRQVIIIHSLLSLKYLLQRPLTEDTVDT